MVACSPKRDHRVTPLRGGPVMTTHQNLIIVLRVSVDLAEATRELKRVPDSFFEVAQVFFG